MARRVRMLVVAVVVVGVLVGCGGGVLPGGAELRGTAVGSAGAPVLGVGFGMVDLSMVTTAGLIPIGGATYVTGLHPVASDGSFRLPLPAAADIPTAVLAPADGFLFDPPAGCGLSADPPAALVSGHVFGDRGALPGVYVASTDGLAFAAVTETAIDMTDPKAYAGRFLVWLYADRPVLVAAVGAGCAGKLDLLLSLERGWNAVGYVYDQPTDSFTVRGAEGVGNVIVTPFPPAGP